MCHHGDEALAWEEIVERHRSDATDEQPEDAVDDPVGEPAEADESEPPAEPRAPADD